MADIMVDAFCVLNLKIRNPTSSLLNFKSRYVDRNLRYLCFMLCNIMYQASNGTMRLSSKPGFDNSLPIYQTMYVCICTSIEMVQGLSYTARVSK